MRTMMRMSIPVEAGNAAVNDGRLPKIIGGLMETLKPEAAYFSPEGERTATFVFDMKDSSQLITIVEPLFAELHAHVEFVPVMNIDDLRKGFVH